MYTEYEISQIQRKKERDIRSAKREQTAFKVAVSETNGELKETMQHSLNYSNQLVKSRQADMREFINATHSKRDYFREQNYAKNVDKGLKNSGDSGIIELNLKSVGNDVYKIGNLNKSE